MSRTSVAVTTRHAVFGQQRLVTLRIFNGHIHRLGLLAASEALVVVLALHAAIALRFSGADHPLAAFEATGGWSAP